MDVDGSCSDITLKMRDVLSKIGYTTFMQLPHFFGIKIVVLNNL